jgi:hypothetical protein
MESERKRGIWDHSRAWGLRKKGGLFSDKGILLGDGNQKFSTVMLYVKFLLYIPIGCRVDSWI